MSATPLIVRNRPFAIEPITGIMMPDGIFDAAIYVQRITCHVHNTANRDLTDVTILMEGVSDPGVILTPVTHHFPTIPAGAAVKVNWEANFQNAAPGKPIVSVVAQEVGNDISRTLKQIFVSRTTFDNTTKKFICEVPEGKLEVSNLTAITSNSDNWKPRCDPEDPRRPDEGLGPYLPISFDAVFVPNPAYVGVHGELPFNDPWWKVLAWIVAAIAAIAGVIVAANSGGTFYTGVKGKFDETGTVDPSIDCCEPDWKSVGKETGLDKGKVTAAGVLSVITTAAIIVGLTDREDPWWRGQAATPPGSGILTQAEDLSVKLGYSDPPNAGVPYKLNVSWTYQRQTTAGTDAYSVEEVQENIHLADNVSVVVPSPIHAFNEPLSIRASFTRPSGEQFRGPELFAFALVLSPNAEFATVVDLLDDGLLPDAKPNDGTYAGEIHLESVYADLRRRNFRFEGRWRVLVFAQDVNLADENDPPHIQAQTIGGFMIASPISISFDTSLPCPITAQATVDVVI